LLQEVVSDRAVKNERERERWNMFSTGSWGNSQSDIKYFFPLQSAECLPRLKGRYHRVDTAPLQKNKQPLPVGVIKKWTV
jgi:hypothetical protein